MSISTDLANLNKWADHIEHPEDPSFLVLKNETKRIQGFITEPEDKRQLSLIQGKIAAIEATRHLFRSNPLDAEEKKISSHPLRNQAERELIISDINQYRGAGDVSICTPCAAAFLKVLSENREPLTGDRIKDAIEMGREAYGKVSTKLPRGRNANYAAGEVIENGELNLTRIQSISRRPQTARAQKDHYMNTIIPELTNRANRRENVTCAILTKAPYSSAIAYRHTERDFIYFDSHGEEATNNKAFIRIFKNPDALCEYLTTKYGFDREFPDVDYDIESGQDNPNLYELTLIDPNNAAPQRANPQPAAARIAERQILREEEPVQQAPNCLRDRCTIL